MSQSLASTDDRISNVNNNGKVTSGGSRYMDRFSPLRTLVKCASPSTLSPKKVTIVPLELNGEAPTNLCKDIWHDN